MAMSAETGCALLSAMLLIVLVPTGCDVQRTMLYYPDHQVPNDSDLALHHFEFWPSRAGYRGFVSRDPAAPAQGTFVVLHGNAGTAWDRTFYAEALLPLGYRVVLAEYPGYGSRPGRPGEAVLVEDAVETIKLAEELYGRPLYVLGESLGCGVAAAVAGRSGPSLDGLLLITPWDTLLSVAKDKFPWLPVRLLMSDAYDSVNNLRPYQGKVAVVAAGHDEVIPAPHAEKMYHSLHQQKQLVTLKGAGHNDWFLAVDRTWWREILGFLEQSPLKPDPGNARERGSR